MDLKVKGKYVFITASTSGIGYETAKAYLDEGANVIINGRSDEKLRNRLSSLRDTYPDASIFGLCQDLTEIREKEIQAFFEESRIPNLDVLVLNLGTGKRRGDNLNIEEWHRFFNVNIFTSVNIISQLLDMVKIKGGSIVFVSSLAGLERLPSPYGYSASKLGIISLMKNLSCDLAEHNIRVNCVAPGNIYFEGGRWQEIILSEPEIEETYIKKEVPMKRFGTPREIANSIVFLSSESSSFTTGATLIVDGGQTKRII